MNLKKKCIFTIVTNYVYSEYKWYNRYSQNLKKNIFSKLTTVASVPIGFEPFLKRCVATEWCPPSNIERGPRECQIFNVPSLLPVKKNCELDTTVVILLFASCSRNEATNNILLADLEAMTKILSLILQGWLDILLWKKLQI